MNTVATPTLYTPEDLLRIPDGNRYELVDGHLVEHDMGYLSSWIAGTIHALLWNFCQAQNLGWVAPPDAGFQCFPGQRNLVRRPDVTFIRRGRLPGERLPEGHARIAPDLAVEVVSPNDTYYEVEGKVRDYLGAGVPLVWVVNPQTRTVRIHRGNGSLTDVREAEELTGEEVVPGFRCLVGDLFPPAGPTPEAATGE
jgi:Uma2 family endonuclease